MNHDYPTPSLRALALAVTLFSTLTATLLVAQLGMTSSAERTGYGIDDVQQPFLAAGR